MRLSPAKGEAGSVVTLEAPMQAQTLAVVRWDGHASAYQAKAVDDAGKMRLVGSVAVPEDAAPGTHLVSVSYSDGTTVEGRFSVTEARRFNRGRGSRAAATSTANSASGSASIAATATAAVALPVGETLTPVNTPTPVLPTPTPTPTRTPTNTPTRTPTPVPPTSTPVPPTSTPVPPTSTPVPPTATRTPVPPTSTPTAGSGTRDKLLQPFASDSPWNMPIGSGAQYVAANLPRTNVE
ncbi:MAG TPA: hypothetical protein VFC53_07695, partial [Dehalococcoidia bacterium]|nr:hypothetical protein [Dehalococcoidia bacterium]